jgi:hypothetical protein
MQFIRQMPLFYEHECHEHKIRFFAFWDINLKYPFLPLSSLKNGVFDKACHSEEVKKYDLAVIGHSHQNFENENAVSVSASGLEGTSYLLIEDSEECVSFERISI